MDENDNNADEAMDGADGGRFSVVVRRNRKSERFSGSPQRTLRKRVCDDTTELPGTPESEKNEKSSPMKGSTQAGFAAVAPAATMEQMYFTPNLDDLAELADDVESILQVDGT